MGTRGSGKWKWLAIAVVVVAVITLASYYLVLKPGPTIKSITISMPNGVGTNTNLNFLPRTLTVVIGVNNTVVWVNQDTTAHTIKTNGTTPVVISTDLINQGQSYTFTFTTPGTYNYFCTIHPGWMRASIVVKAGS